ncbi:ATP-binding protein [Streptomyces sp. MN03-5084-2B]|nr:ATP-binding protein [Streptomyces sp. MN03-5084-2B]
MTSIQSLTTCAAVDVTWERVESLVALAQPEGLLLEYKREYSPSLIKTVAAMANSYGGLILIGIADAKHVTQKPGTERIVGVPGETATRISNGCANALDPPWQPEIIEVAVPGTRDTFVLVVRVDPARAPHPILIENKAPIRVHGGTTYADRARLALLFMEESSLSGQARLAVPRPELPRAHDGTPAADYVLRSGMQIPVDEAANWRPLSERGVHALAAALNASPLQQRLQEWCDDLKIPNLHLFRRQGFNRARHVRLAWQASADDGAVPIEVIAEAVLPTSPGVPNSRLRFTVDVLPAVQRYVATRAAERLPPGFQRPVAMLNLGGLHRLVEAVLATLTDQAVVEALAGFAGIDPIVVPQPTGLDLHSGPAITDLLDMSGLQPVTDAGASHGANLLAQPALDLRDPTQRHRQIDDWLVELALDAGFTGMEERLDLYHRLETKEATGP